MPPIEQGTDEWFAQRLGKATGSRFADIMATGRNGYEPASRKNYRAQLVTERLTGYREETYSNAAMQWGTEYEPVARLRYELLTGNIAEECGFFTHDTLQAGASPDGLVNDDGLLEIKCPNTATHIETLKRSEVPSKYKWQVQGQLWITGKKWCDFVSFDPRMPENAQVFITRVPRDEEAIEELAGQVQAFLREVEAEVQFVTNYKEK